MLDLRLIEKVHFTNKTKNRTNCDIDFEKCALMIHSYYIILYFHVQIEICRNEIGSDNIIHVNIQAKTAKAVK